MHVDFPMLWNSASRNSICVHEGICMSFGRFPWAGHHFQLRCPVLCSVTHLTRLQKLPSMNFGTKENIPVLMELLSHLEVGEWWEFCRSVWTGQLNHFECSNCASWSMLKASVVFDRRSSLISLFCQHQIQYFVILPFTAAWCSKFCMR